MKSAFSVETRQGRKWAEVLQTIFRLVKLYQRCREEDTKGL